MKKFWTVVIIIVVIAVVGYGGYRVWHHYNRPAPQPAATQMQTTKAKPSAMMEQNSVYKMMAAGNLGNVMTDPKGMTLYTFANDKPGVSNCSGTCLKLWPAYKAPSQTGTFPANISVVKRSDGTFQYAWKGMPLYYYVKDTKAGDVTGNGVGGVWSVVK